MSQLQLLVELETRDTFSDEQATQATSAFSSLAGSQFWVIVHVVQLPYSYRGSSTSCMHSYLQLRKSNACPWAPSILSTTVQYRLARMRESEISIRMILYGV
jgi:hypothetical protein